MVKARPGCSLAIFAIRCSFVEMVIELRVSSSVSVTGPHFQLALPSPGSPRLRFPGFFGTTARSDSSTPFPRRFVSFDQRYHAASTNHAGSRDASCLRRVWVPVCGRSLCVEISRSPRFLGSPSRACPALRPRRGRNHQVISVARCCLPKERHRRPSRSFVSRLDHTAYTLAVYASQQGSPRATQDSLPVGDQPSPGGVEYPRDSIEGFRFRSFVLLLQACLAHLSCSFSGRMMGLRTRG